MKRVLDEKLVQTTMTDDGLKHANVANSRQFCVPQLKSCRNPKICMCGISMYLD